MLHCTACSSFVIKEGEYVKCVRKRKNRPFIILNNIFYVAMWKLCIFDIARHFGWRHLPAVAWFMSLKLSLLMYVILQGLSIYVVYIYMVASYQCMNTSRAIPTQWRVPPCRTIQSPPPSSTPTWRPRSAQTAPGAAPPHWARPTRRGCRQHCPQLSWSSREKTIPI